MKPDYTYKAHVTRVIDGDTVVLDIDLGFRMWAVMPIRLWGINAPERGKEGWGEAKAHLEQLLGEGVVVVETRRNPEKYGRWLGIVHCSGVNVNDAMVEAGMAVRSAS